MVNDPGRERMVRIVGERYADCGFSTFDVGNDKDTRKRIAAKSAVMQYAKEIEQNRASGRNLILLGPVGTGKDHLAAAVVRTVVGRGFSVAFVRGSVLAQEMKAAITGEPLDPKYGSRDFLLISDIEPRGNDATTEFFHASLLDLLDERYRAKLPTIITTNKEERVHMDAAIGARSMDRLLEHSLAVKMDWPSYRTAVK